MAQRVIIIHRNPMGYLVDDAGNGYNEKFQPVDDWGNVIPDPWKEPATSSFGNGSTGAWKPQTLADYNNPYFSMHKRAELQKEIECLEEIDLLEDELTKVWSEYEGEVEFDESGHVSIDTVACVDRHMPGNQGPDEDLTKAESWESSENVSVDTVLCVDRQEPNLPASDVLEKIDASEPPPEPLERVLELADPDLDPESPEPDPEPLEHHEKELVEVLPKETATPGSCHKRKLPDTTLQPPFKRIRAHPGVSIILIAADLIDPGDTYAVYSNGPRPPPLEQWYVLFELPSSLEGGCSQTPRQSHLEPAYLPDPEETDAVYHIGPRPP